MRLPSQPAPSSGSAPIRRTTTLRLAALTLGAAAIVSSSACGSDSSAAAPSTGIAASDLDRIAAGSKNPSGDTSSPTTTTAASGIDRPSSATTAAKTTSPVDDSRPGSAAATTKPVTVEFPDAAKAHTQDGAKAFVQFYWETLASLDAKPRLGVLDNLASTSCRSCQAQMASVAAMFKDGSHVEAAAPQFTTMRIRGDSTNDSVVVTFDQSGTSATKIQRNGHREALRPVNLAVAARADWEGEGWKLGESGADQK